MKFTTTKNAIYRAGIGKIPKPWIEYKRKNNVESIHKYFYDNIKRWDWDVCGTEIHDFVFENGKAYRIEYSWWSEWYHKNDDDNGLKDVWYLQEISIDKANVPEKKIGRDWL